MAGFDRLAEQYDRIFSDTRLGQWLRASMWDVLGGACAPGRRVLDVGCGTGEDAIWLAQQDVEVVATDASASMLEVARRKAGCRELAGRIQFVQTDAGALGVGGLFDAAVANFGALNCVADRRRFGRELAARVRPGGRLVLVVMGPLCAWETAWHLLHGDLYRATCRWRAGRRARVGDARVPVWYPSPGRLCVELGQHFGLKRLVGVGAVLPPSYLWHIVARWPPVFEPLAGLDTRVPFGAYFAEHYIALFERRRAHASDTANSEPRVSTTTEAGAIRT